MSKLTRRVIIEKTKCTNPIFPTTMKGMYDSLYFFESIGGRGLYFNGINNPNIESTIKRANQIWHQLNHHTLEEIKTIAQKD
jgi:hypothetical protein